MIKAIDLTLKDIIERYELDTTLWPSDVDRLMPIVTKMLAVFEAIEGHDIENLQNKVRSLKQTDGEGWAVGEMLRRALEL